MIKNRLIALIFRLIAFAVALSGVLVGSGFSKGLKRFLFYTGQTNLLVCALFFVLSVYTFIGLIKNGARGSACYLPRLSHACALCIAYTLIVFWCALAPFAKIGGLNLLSYGNLITHTLTPILAALNCVLFCQKGCIKKRDVALWPLLPLAYIIFCYILSAFNVTFYTQGGIPHHYPYYFMDFSALGLIALVFLALIGATFTLSAYLIYRLDSKPNNRINTAKNI